MDGGRECSRAFSKVSEVNQDDRPPWRRYMGRGARGLLGLGRLVYAVVASAILCVHGTSSPAQAAPRALIEGEFDPELRKEILRVIGETDDPIENRFEARRRAREAAEDAMAVLRSEGYYAYAVDADVGDGDTPTPVVRITPGPRVTIAAPSIDWVGEAPDPQTIEAAREALDLQVGEPGRAAEIVAAEGRAVAAVQKGGYADVQARPREVIVDHADDTMRPTFRIAPGDIVRLDGIELITDGRTRLGWLRRLAPWEEGETYDPGDVAELERRLLDAGVYDTVTVALAPAAKTTREGLRPVVVSLADRELRTLELGLSYSTTEGAGVDARWTRYNLLGRADTLALIGRLSTIDSRLAAEITLPHWRRPAEALRASVGAYRTTTDAYDETGFGVRADLTRRFGATSFLTYGGALDFTRTKELSPSALTPLGRDLVIAAGLVDLSLDRSNDPLDPTQGWRVIVRAEPTVLAGDEALPYLKVQTQGSAYLPLDAAARTVIAGRLRVGSLVNGAIPDVPASRRFYAGGGGSVRGFPYQAVGPRLADNTPQGGLSIVEASLEVRQDLTQRWGVVVFVDAGAVGSNQTPDFSNLSVGAGFGVRYDLGFGPIRVDIATPVTDDRGESDIHLYVSIGQSF